MPWLLAERSHSARPFAKYVIQDPWLSNNTELDTHQIIAAIRRRYRVRAVCDSSPPPIALQEANDTEVVTDALRHCGGYDVIATEAKIAADKKARTKPG